MDVPRDHKRGLEEILFVYIGRKSKSDAVYTCLVFVRGGKSQLRTIGADTARNGRFIPRYSQAVQFR